MPAHDLRDERRDERLELRRHRREDPRARDRPCRSGRAPPPPPPPANWSTNCCGTPARDELDGNLRGQPVGEERAGDRQADRAADLLEERQAARGDADLRRGWTVFWTMSVNTANDGPMPRPAMTIHSHRIGRSVSACRLVSRNRPTARSDQRAEDEQLVAIGPGHDLARRRRADDQARTAAAGGCSPTRSRSCRRPSGTSAAGRRPRRRTRTPARNIAVTEIVKVRMRNRLSGTIGSGDPRSPTTRRRAEDEAEQDQAADPRIGPVRAGAACSSGRSGTARSRP